MIRQRTVFLAVLLLLAGVSSAQTTAPTSAPTTGPATTRRARWELVLPPGFVKLTVGDHLAICEAANEPWVKEALSTATPATRPTTMPLDLVGRLSSHRAALVKQITSDFGLTDSSTLDKFIDETIVPELKRLQDFHPPIYLMPITGEKLKEIVKGGWGAPKFYYNRVADDVAYQFAIALSLDNMDDHVYPVIYRESDSPEARKQFLRERATEMQASILARIAGQGQASLQQGLIHFIDTSVFAPMQLKPGQEWFGIGAEGVFSARYLAMVNDLPVERFIRYMTTDDPGNPIRSGTVDLLHLTPPAQLRPQYAPAYYDAMRRKSITVVNDWLAKVPAEMPSKVIAAINKSKPADGEALVKIIKETSGVDLSDEVKPH